MNIFKKCIALFLLGFFLLKPFVFVLAQGTTPNPTLDNINKNKNDAWDFITNGQIGELAVPLPGVNCGVANGDTVLVQRCCNSNATLNSPLLKPLDMILNSSVSGTINNNQVLEGFFYSLKVFATNIPVLGWLLNIGLNQIDQLKTKYQQLRQFQSQNPGVACIYGEPNKSVNDPTCQCIASEPTQANRSLAKICYNYLTNSKELGSCVSCAGGGGIWTALGCIPTDVQGFISTFLLSTGIGLGGIVALMCIIYAAFQMQTSRGNPEKIKKAQELLTSCIMGLILIIFSVFILRLIGVNILRIPFLQ